MSLFVRNPHQIVKIGQKVKVKVYQIESLSNWQSGSNKSSDA